MDWTIQEDPALRGYTVEWAEPGKCLLSRRHVLYESSDLRPPFRRVGAFPAPLWRRFAAHVRLAQRFLRFSYYNVLRLADGSFFVTFDRSMAMLRDGRFTPVGGMVRPFRILRGGAALWDDGRVYFGEYIRNDVRETGIHLYRYTPGERDVEQIRYFERGFIRHVHGMYRDPYEKGLWLCAGDTLEECRMLRSTDGFQTFDAVGEGDESWRAVSVQFTPHAICYATDAEYQQNYVYRIDRRSGRRDILGEVDGPVYYSCAVGADLFFGVSAEASAAQRGRSATLWHVDAGGGCRKVVTFEKDRWPMRLALAGTYNFPAGPGWPDRLVFGGVATEGGDNRTFWVTPKR